METNRVNEAVPLLRQAVASGSDDPIGHYALATALAQTGEEAEAVDEYRKALALNPNPPAAWYDHLAVLLTRTGDLPGAAENLRASLTLDPSDAGTEDNLGTILCEMGQAQRRIRAPAQSHLHGSRLSRGAQSSRLGVGQDRTLDEAVTQLNQAIELRPGSVEYHVNLGYVLASAATSPGPCPCSKRPWS